MNAITVAEKVLKYGERGDCYCEREAYGVDLKKSDFRTCILPLQGRVFLSPMSLFISAFIVQVATSVETPALAVMTSLSTDTPMTTRTLPTTNR